MVWKIPLKTDMIWRRSKTNTFAQTRANCIQGLTNLITESYKKYYAALKVAADYV